MKNKDAPERGIEKYNYLKSIKDKEQQILTYYKKINHSASLECFSYESLDFI